MKELIDTMNTEVGFALGLRQTGSKWTGKNPDGAYFEAEISVFSPIENSEDAAFVLRMLKAQGWEAQESTNSIQDIDSEEVENPFTLTLTKPGYPPVVEHGHSREAAICYAAIKAADAKTNH
jgi:hypothetical protein